MVGSCNKGSTQVYKVFVAYCASRLNQHGLNAQLTLPNYQFPNQKRFSSLQENIPSENRNNNGGIVKSLYADIKPMVGVTVSEFILDRCSHWPPRLIATVGERIDCEGLTLHREEKINNFVCIQECGVTGRKYSYSEVVKYSRAFAAALIQGGYGPGDTLGIVLQNCPEYALVLLGAWEAGLTVIILYKFYAYTTTLTKYV